MKLGYFPGCSLHATAIEYCKSLKVLFKALGDAPVEIDDWSCCGATAAHATHDLLAISLAARNLALAEEQGFDRVLAPCAACFSRLATARMRIEKDGRLGKKVGEILGRDFRNSVGVINIVQYMLDHLEELEKAVKNPLRDLNVACFYGCLLLRPHEVTRFDDPEAPSSLERIVTALGARPVDWRMRLDCCGAGLSISRKSSVVRLGREILTNAVDSGADVVMVACPMCQSNLDLRQAAMARGQDKKIGLPIIFVPQLAGLALGEPEERLGLNRHFVSTKALIRKSEGLAAAST